MNIDRQEIIRYLTNNGAHPHNIQPALQFVEPVFRMLETDFDLSPQMAPPSAREIKTAIFECTAPSRIIRWVWMLPISRAIGHHNLLSSQHRGLPFGTMSSAMIQTSKPRVLSVISPSLDRAVDIAFPSSLGTRLQGVLANPSDADASIAVVTENVRTIFANYFNLTAANMTSVIKQRISPIIRLLPRMLPIACDKQDTRVWTVFIR